MNSKSEISHKLTLFRQSLWFFPVILFILVLLLSLFKISGTSVGIFHQSLKGASQKDPNLLLGKPRLIRSDESTVNTPVVVSQARSNYKQVSQLIGEGHDMSVVLDVPYLEWSSIFKPQNWAFFVMPLEHAFAFKWWLLAWSLVVSCYLFVTTLIPKQRLLAGLLSLSVFFSPFIQWWYQTITIAPLAYSFIMLAILLRLKPETPIKKKFLFGAALTYVLVGFALILYPPFQIPCLLGVAAFYLGFLLQKKGNWSQKLAYLYVPAISAIIAIAIIGLFLLTRASVVETITSTVYPGHRIVQSGGYGITHYFSGPFQASLMSDSLAKFYPINQSEASNFIMLWPTLLIPSLYVAYRRWRIKLTPPWALLSINLLLLILAARLFLPLPEIIPKLLLLESVPHNRLLIGIGLVALIQIVLLLKENQEPFPKWLIILTTGFAVALFSTAGIKLEHDIPEFIPNIWMLIIPILTVGIFTAGLLSRRPIIGVAALLLFTFASTFAVNPIYKGLGSLTGSQLSKELNELAGSKDGSKWVFLDAGTYTNFLIAQGIPSYNATYSYPQLELWKRYDPTGELSFYYNRYANVFFSSTPSDKLIIPGTLDSFGVSYNPCNKVFASIRYVVIPGPLTSECLEELDNIKEPNKEFYVYRVKQ